MCMGTNVHTGFLLYVLRASTMCQPVGIPRQYLPQMKQIRITAQQDTCSPRYVKISATKERQGMTNSAAQDSEF